MGSIPTVFPLHFFIGLGEISRKGINHRSAWFGIYLGYTKHLIFGEGEVGSPWREGTGENWGQEVPPPFTTSCFYDNEDYVF